MPNVRLTINPAEVITISDAEYADLLRQGLIYALEDGPPIEYPDFSPAQYAEIARLGGRRIGDLFDTPRPIASGVIGTWPSEAAGILVNTVAPALSGQTGTLWNSPKFRYLGGGQLPVNPAAPAAGVLTRSNGSGLGLQPTQLETIFYGQYVAAMFQTYGPADVDVFIDGCLVNAAPYVTAGAGVYYLKVPFASRGAHRIRFVIGNGVFYQLVHQVADSFILPGRPPIIGLDGDSYFDVGTSPNFGGLGLELARLTGCGIAYLAQGSTGYDAQLDTGDLAKSPFESAARNALRAAADYDVLILGGSINSGLKTPEQVEAAFDELFTAFQEDRPTTPVVLIGVEPLDLGAAEHAANNTALAARAEAAPNVVGFIDWYTEDWFTGTGSDDAPIGDGNQDEFVSFDDVHANRAGNALLVAAVVSRMSGMPLTVPLPG